MAKVAFLGLGVMGGPMARHLAAKGHEVTVYNRTAARAEAWVASHGHRHALTPREAAEGAEFVMACVGNDDDLRSVCLGPDGVFAGMAAGTIFVDHTTVSAKVTAELADVARAASLAFVDAPVSGGQAGAEELHDGADLQPVPRLAGQSLDGDGGGTVRAAVYLGGFYHVHAVPHTRR